MITNSKFNQVGIAVAAVTLGLSFNSSDAQAQKLEELVVTAQKREQNVNDIGVTVSALGADRLDEIGYSDPSDLAKFVPGFSYSDSAFNTPIYTLRGVGFNENSLAASSTVSVYVDEVPFPFPATTQGAALDLQRVEVVKGPQGTLYGQNTTAGAINYISNKPTETFESGIKAGIGRFSSFELEGYVSGALSENVRARFAAKTNQADGWQRSSTRGDENAEVDKSSARLIVEVDASEDVALTFTASGWTDKGETQAPQLLEIDLEFPNNANPLLLAQGLSDQNDPRDADFDPDFSLAKDNEYWKLAARVDWDINDRMDFTSITAYSEYDSLSGNETDGTPVEIFNFIVGGTIDAFSQEFRLSGATDKADWVVGLNYSDNSTRDTNVLRAAGTSANFVGLLSDGVSFGTGSGVRGAENFADQELQTFGVFASADWHLTDKLDLTTGIRFTDFQAELDACAGGTSTDTVGGLGALIQFVSGLVRGGAGLDPLPGSFFGEGVFDNGFCTTFIDPMGDINLTGTPGVISNELEEDNVSWRLALNYRPNDDILTYGSISQGFKAGSFPTIPSTSFVQYDAAVQEEILAYEVGIKATLLDQTLQLNSAAFFYDYENKQQRGFFRDEVFGGLSLLDNVPESEVYGLEADAVWLPANGLTIITSFLLLETEITEHVALDSTATDLVDFSGGVLSFSPESQFNFDIEYEFGVTNEIAGFVGADYSYRDSASAVFGEDPRLELPSYSLVGLRAGLIADEWQLTVYGENVTDEYYLSNILPQFDTIRGFTGLPATYGVRFKYDF